MRKHITNAENRVFLLITMAQSNIGNPTFEIYYTFHSVLFTLPINGKSLKLGKYWTTVEAAKILETRKLKRTL